MLATSRAADSEAIVNTYDGLVEYDMENVMQPALATEWSVDETGTKYTFKIREGVIWVDSQGRKVDDVTADDFVAGMNHMLDAMGGLEYLVGSDGGCAILNAQACIDGEISDFSQVGVKALDDYTVEYTLEQPTPYFMTMLGYGVFAPMSREYFLSQGGGFGEEYAADSETYLYGKDPDHIAYCGPYIVSNLTPENTIVFSANESYWNKDNINLQTITWKFNDGQDALKAYNDMKANVIASAGLNASALEVAKQDGYFDKYVRVSVTILQPGEQPPAEEKDVIEIDQDFINAPLHDTGSKWYVFLSFLLPLLGFIVGGIFKKKKHYRNYKACRKGAVAGLIFFGAIIVLFAIFLILAII